MTEQIAKAKAQRFEDVVVWQKAHAFVLDIYGLSGKFPIEERFGLTSQFRRAAVSIAANFAEGFRKTGIADKIRFFNTSQGSIEECRYYLILTRDLGYAETSALENRLDEVSRMLGAYSKSVKRNHPYRETGARRQETDKEGTTCRAPTKKAQT